MSDLPLLPVYLAGSWPAASWYVRHHLDGLRHTDRGFHEDQEEVSRDAFLVALDDQLRAGADIVTTQLGLPGVVEGITILDRIQGLEVLPHRKRLRSRLFHQTARYQQTKPLIALRGLGLCSDAERLMSLSSTLSVMTITGPYTLSGLIHGGPSRLTTAQTLSGILRDEMESLGSMGVTMIQLDEPGMAWSNEDPATLADLVRRTVDGLPIEIHLRLGYLDGYGRPMNRRSYRPWLSPLAAAVVAATMNVRQFDLAFAATDLSEVGVLKEIPARRVGLGIIDTTCTWVEPVSLLVERIHEAKLQVPAERLWIAADAGLASLSRNVAIRKVNNMVEAARLVRTEMGVKEATPSTPVLSLPTTELEIPEARNGDISS